MQSQNPISKIQLPRLREVSSQQSPRDPGSTGQLWKEVSKVSAQDRVNVQTIARIERVIERLRRRIVGGGGMVPGGTVTVHVCDPCTGTEKTYNLTGTEV
jgi:hypothetical protein